MKIFKRDGREQEVSFDKIIDRIKYSSENLSNIIEPVEIAQKVISFVKDGIHTREIDEVTAQICMDMSIQHPDFQSLASNVIISNHHKNTIGCFSDKIIKLYKNRDHDNKLHPIVSKHLYRLVMKHKTQLDKMIDYERDYQFDYFGFKTLEKSYLLRIHKNGSTEIVERPQDMFLRVSLALHGDDLESVRNSYELLSNKYFTHASPTLFNAGTPRSQYSSCFLLGMADSVDGIFKCISDCAHISKWSGGLGVCASDIRAKGSLIRGTNGKTDGIIPMLRVMNDVAVYINQSGKRKGAIAIYLEPHHPDILEFLDLRKNHGKEEMRARDLFTAVWLNDYFIECVREDKEWHLFCPDECPGLSEAYGDTYKELCLKYLEDGKARKTVKARDVWKAMIVSQIETGTPYMSNKDAANLCSNQKNIGTIKNSNLCCEVYLYNSPEEYAVCTLASLCLPSYVVDGVFDHEKLREVVYQVVANLNKIIDLNYYPVKETKRSNMKHRPLGVGVQGLADVYLKMRLPYDSPEAMQLNKEIFETIYYAALEKSVQLAKTEGTYESWDGCPMSKGLFQFDMWRERGHDVSLSKRWDWDALRERVMEHGLRNSTLVALMPTASTSQIMGNQESFEPYTSNIYSRKTLAGNFTIINKFLINDLIELGLWNKDMVQELKRSKGSVQNMDIPQELKDLYKTIWEVKQKVMIDQSADRGPFVCQSQSMNLYFQDPQFSRINSALLYAHKRGLKTMCYYVRTRAASDAIQFTVAKKEEPIIEVIDDEEVCVSCSG